MVKRSESGDLGGLWLEGHGRPEGSETLGASSRVRRAAPSLQIQSDEPVVASYGAPKTATLTVLVARAAAGAVARAAHGVERDRAARRLDERHAVPLLRRRR